MINRIQFKVHISVTNVLALLQLVTISASKVKPEMITSSLLLNGQNITVLLQWAAYKRSSTESKSSTQNPTRNCMSRVMEWVHNSDLNLYSKFWLAQFYLTNYLYGFIMSATTEKAPWMVSEGLLKMWYFARSHWVKCHSFTEWICRISEKVCTLNSCRLYACRWKYHRT